MTSSAFNSFNSQITKATDADANPIATDRIETLVSVQITPTQAWECRRLKLGPVKWYVWMGIAYSRLPNSTTSADVFLGMYDNLTNQVLVSLLCGRDLNVHANCLMSRICEMHKNVQFVFNMDLGIQECTKNLHGALMDLGVLEETIRLSTTAQDAVLLPDGSGSSDLTVLNDNLMVENDIQGADSPHQASASVVDESGLVVLDIGVDSLSSNRISSSNSTIRFDNSGQPVVSIADTESRKALLLAAGCGYWEELNQHNNNRKPETKSILTAIDLLSRITTALTLCIRKCKNEHNAKTSSLLMDWLVRTGVWKYTPENMKISSICNGRRETHAQIVRILVSHARRSGMTCLARALGDWLSNTSDELPQAHRESAPDHEDVFVVDPRRMTMLALAQLLGQLNWQPQVAKSFQLTDRHLIRPLLAVCVSNSVVAARLFASFDQLPKICSKLHQEADAQGLDECFKLLCPKDEEWSFENLPTSILSTGSASGQWWESSDTIVTLAHVVRGTNVPFSSLICAVVAEDDSELLLAIEEAFTLYAIIELSDVSIDPKRRALLCLDGGKHVTSRDWCISIFNVLCRRWLQSSDQKMHRAEELVKRTAAGLEELKLLRAMLSAAANDVTARELLTSRVIWRTLVQAARNENKVPPPSLTRYISPELLAECPTAVAPMASAFNLWWDEDSSAVMRLSLLRRNRAMIGEHACKNFDSRLVNAIESGQKISGSTFDLTTKRALDAALLTPAFMESRQPDCQDFTTATLYFLICGESREMLVDQMVASSICLRPKLLRCLWTGEYWGPLLKELLIHYCVNSEESVHMMSVCTLLSTFPSYAALELTCTSPWTSGESSPKSETSALPVPDKYNTCRSLRGPRFLQHSIGGLLNEYIDPGKLLSIHAARELLKAITALPEMGPCQLKFDTALCAVYESGKKHLNVLGLALSESVRLLLNDQMVMVKELESKCQKSLLKCVELADQSRQQVRDVCLSSTVCDICGLLLTQHATPPDIHTLEHEAFEGKVCAMNRCDHRFHAICLRSLAIALAPNKSEILGGYESLLKIFDSFRNIESEGSIKAELIRNLQNLISQNCPLCSNDLTIAI